jgi:hypothetical protein
MTDEDSRIIRRRIRRVPLGEVFEKVCLQNPDLARALGYTIVEADVRTEDFEPRSQGDLAIEREALIQHFMSQTGESVILNLCHAANVRYPKFRAWRHGELKQGSAPDKRLRALLIEGKRTNRGPRPHLWK